MQTLFVGVGQLGWRTMARAIREYQPTRRGFGREHIELVLPGVSESIRVKAAVPLRVRQLLDPQFRTREQRLRAGLERVVQLERIDHIHFMGHLVAVPSVLDELGVPFSVTLDSTEISNRRDLRRYGWPQSSIASRVRLRAESDVLGRAEFVCATSMWARRSVIDDYGVPPHRVHLNPFPLAGRAAPRRVDASWLTFIGNAFYRKSGERLVRWHQGHLGARAELHIVSQDPAAQRYRSLPGVVLHPDADNDIVRQQILPRTAVLALPTRYDQSPIVLSEAAAAGVPAVASDLAGIPEQLLDGQTGFLVDARDDAGFVAAIDRLLSDRDLAARMGRAARVHYERELRAETSLRRLHALIATSSAEELPELMSSATG